jgi:hypothetical protein
MWLRPAQDKPKHGNRVFPAHLRSGETPPDPAESLKHDPAEPSGYDKARVGTGPVSVAAPASADPGDGLPPEWLGRGSDKQVDHD